MTDEKARHAVEARLWDCPCNDFKGYPQCKQCQNDMKLLKILNVSINRHEEIRSLVFIIVMTVFLFGTAIFLLEFL